MNYERIYAEFIADRRNKEAALIGYTEKHHILPRSLGGTDDASNLISLAAGDHYFAHLLLAHAYGEDQWLAVAAMVNMPGSSKRREFLAKRRWVDTARRKSAAVHAANAREMHKNGLTEKAHSPKAKAKRSATIKALKSTPEARAEQAAIARGLWANPETREKLMANVLNQSPEAREAKRQRWLEHNPMNDPEARAKTSAASKAYHNREDVRAAKRARFSGKNNPTKRPEVAAKIAEACKSRDMSKTSGKNRPVINLDTGEVFYNIQVAAKSCGSKHVSAVCLGKRKTAGGYRWAYANEMKAAA